MSSTSRPEFRLDFGYPEITLTRKGASAPLATATPGAPTFAADLRRLAASVGARGRVTVVLPEAEVWRGQLALSGRSFLARRGAARAAAAERLAAAPSDVSLTLGTTSGGLTPVTAVRRSTLAETGRLLAGAGIRPAAIRGAGTFPGFATPPRLGGNSLPAPPRPLVLGAAVGAALAALALGLPRSAPEPASAPVRIEASVAAPDAQVADRTPASPQPAVASPPVQTAKPVSLALARAKPPLARPAPTAQPVATLATRNLPRDFAEARRVAPEELRLAELTTARVRMVDGLLTPLHRPAPVAAISVPPSLRPMHRPGTAAAARPATAAPAPVASVEASGRPRPRPGAAPAPAAPLRVASLQPADAVAVTLAGAAAVAALPPARPDAPKTAAPAKPAAERAVPAQPKAAARPPAPSPVVRKAPVTAAPVAQRQPPPAVTARRAPVAVVRAAPAPVRQATVVRQAPTVRQAAAPKVTATLKPTRKVVRATAQPRVATRTARHTSKAAAFASERPGSRRGNVALIGVFGGSTGRHALLRMPNGNVERVRAGDRVQGVQVAAVGADSVRLERGGRETVLKLPD